WWWSGQPQRGGVPVQEASQAREVVVGLARLHCLFCVPPVYFVTDQSKTCMFIQYF
ncbi:hypothetical protein UFOVP662_80, partial [uncultured Caudovirales phage]